MRCPDLAGRLDRACVEGAGWLLHPALHAVLSGSEAHRPERDFALVAWAARHLPIEGEVTLEAPSIVWTDDGGAALEAGRYSLRDLPRDHAQQGPPIGPICIDPWCASVGFPVACSWAEAPPQSDGDVAELTETIKRYGNLLALFERMLPATFEWVSTVTRVVIPLRARHSTTLRSHSSEDCPGMVALNIPFDLVALVELLVHESAHHHLFVADVGEPLVREGHEGQYRSPLRTDPRPLRGVLLAYHALAYIGAAYRELQQIGRLDSPRLWSEYQKLLGQAGEASTVIDEASESLTPAGREFVQRTAAVAAYGASSDG